MTEVTARVLYIDPLVVSTILEKIRDAKDLAPAALVCKAFHAAAMEVASEQLFAVLHEMNVLPRRQMALVGPSRVAELGTWASVRACNVLWLRADEERLTTRRPSDMPFSSTTVVVARMEDMSGSGQHASAPSDHRMPTFIPDALGPGLGAIGFDGKSFLETRRFASPMPQPLTLVLVARARGDTTLCDSLSPSSSRFELCHGYPNAQSRVPTAPEVVMSAHGAGNEVPSQLLRGATRSTDEWHVYTAIFDEARSEIYIDGRLEARGKSIGKSSLDGLRVGCDHTSTFFLNGAVAELRLFACHLSEGARTHIEAALSMRYGLKYDPAASSPAELRRSSSDSSRSSSASSSSSSSRRASSSRGSRSVSPSPANQLRAQLTRSGRRLRAVWPFSMPL